MDPKMTPEELEKFIHRELRALPPRKAPAGFEARLQAAVSVRTNARPAAENLETLVHGALRDLPLRRAPATLEARVLAEIERRATIAWYHKSWSYWPAAVRSGFLVLGSTFAAVAIVFFYQLSQGAAAETVVQNVSSGFSWLAWIGNAVSWVFRFAYQQIQTLPSLWLYGGLAFIGVTYATCVGLGAAAYRFLVRRVDPSS